MRVTITKTGAVIIDGVETSFGVTKGDPARFGAAQDWHLTDSLGWPLFTCHSKTAVVSAVRRIVDAVPITEGETSCE